MYTAEIMLYRMEKMIRKTEEKLLPILSDKELIVFRHLYYDYIECGIGRTYGELVTWERGLEKILESENLVNNLRLSTKDISDMDKFYDKLDDMYSDFLENVQDSYFN